MNTLHACTPEFVEKTLYLADAVQSKGHSNVLPCEWAAEEPSCLKITMPTFDVRGFWRDNINVVVVGMTQVCHDNSQA